MTIQRLTFTNPQGDELAARLDTPEDQAPTAYVLFAHCFTCSKNLTAVGNISRAMTEHGFGVLRFDFTGLGESDGVFSETNFSSNVADLICAADMLEEQFAAPSILLGHSLGGAAVLQAAGEIGTVEAVATIGAPHDPEHVTHLLEDSVEEIETTGVANVTLGGRSFTIKKQFLDDLEAASMTARIRSLDRALMVFHSPVDETVGVENARKIFEDAKHPKSFISLDDADHLLTDERDSRYVGTMVAAWASRYLNIQPKRTAQVKENPNDVPMTNETPTGDGFVEGSVGGTRTETGRKLYRTAVQSGTHRLIADEPESVGGGDLGPTPYDLLLSALGTCTSMTLRMYADRKEWPMDKAIVTLSHSKIHAEDCRNCESETGKVDRIERKIDVRGNLSDKQRVRLLEIADKCPVHRTLHGEIVVDSELVGDGSDETLMT